MKKSVRHLTQDELVEELQKRGFEIKERTISEWRRNHLLPAFDIIGSGLGKGQGRDRGSWSQSKSVINQALWVCKLRPRYRRYEDLYIPLWMLGCPIPLEIVRALLSHPLMKEVETLKAEAAAFIRKFKINPSRKGVVEDLIDDAVNDLGSFTDNIPEAFKMPPEVIEGLLNIFLNPDCDMEDPAGVFKSGSEAVKRWNIETKKMELEICQAEGLTPSNQSRQDDTFSNVFKHGLFFQKNFSLHQLQKAVIECTNDDLKQVQIDMTVLCEIGLLLNKIFGLLMKDVSSELKAMKQNLLIVLLGLGKWSIWADLSLRHNGYAQMINTTREYARNEIKEKVNETLERELAEAAPDFAKGMEKAADVMERVFTTRIVKTGIQCVP